MAAGEPELHDVPPERQTAPDVLPGRRRPVRHAAPLGIGPHPGRTEASLGAKETSELAVMLDTFRPLRAAKEAAEVEDPGYYRSWVEFPGQPT